ncbi:hypothetical protein KP509_33G060100 [Ceratopteris richardii]|uniref:Uncharacterized protein n=1 Tax=Ceratopteris richardii TaxID=49495 RepID=A0A8T2QRC4_CERRI|nr:hypothetical protein KP509_33G060100 [Ceratopteris richardii]KAH7286139.1 hypothetical protein KP509_33G060100 [Ceratopteris richardii]
MSATQGCNNGDMRKQKPATLKSAAFAQRQVITWLYKLPYFMSKLPHVPLHKRAAMQRANRIVCFPAPTNATHESLQEAQILPTRCISFYFGGRATTS